MIYHNLSIAWAPLPPVPIELSITKPQNLSQQVQDGVKHQVEEDQPEQMIGQLNT